MDISTFLFKTFASLATIFVFPRERLSLPGHIPNLDFWASLDFKDGPFIFFIFFMNDEVIQYNEMQELVLYY